MLADLWNWIRRKWLIGKALPQRKTGEVIPHLLQSVLSMFSATETPGLFVFDYHALMNSICAASKC